MKTFAACFLIIFVSGIGMVVSDPDMLQDICVADRASAVKVNGFACKAASNVTAEDFFFTGLSKPGVVNNSVGSLVTGANVAQIAGLNTLGVSMARIDYVAGGLNPPHTHPRATEIVFVLEGSLDVGFITTANVLISKTIMKGEVFVFPKGLVHFQKNNGEKPASVIAAFNSQLPGTQSLAMTLFGATPPVPDNVLTKAFQIGTKEVQKIKTKFAPKNMVASDPDMLQDICVANPSSAAKMNGFACQDYASNATAQDFFFTGICQPGNITNAFGSLVTGANVENIPGLNTLGVSLSRIDYLAGGLNPPHTHPRATEIVFVLQGSLDVGFITTSNTFISKTIMKGEVFVFPKGTVHFQKNNGDEPASVIAAFNSQLPGTQSIAMTLFGAKPAVPDNVLAQAFQIDTTEVQTIKSKFAPKM